MFNNKRNRIFLVMLVMFLFLGTMGTAYASPAAPSTVGVIDYLYLINQHPDTVKANEALRAEREQASKEFAEKSVTMSEQDKQSLDWQLGLRLEQRRQELLKPITEKINAAIKEVADDKGLAVVVGKNIVIYGGMDITEAVLKKINGK